MEQENFDNNNDRPIESVYSTRIRAGKRRTYFFDVRATRSNDYFLTITESRKRFDNNGYDRHKIFIYKEDFNKFIKAVTEAMDFVKTELMPDFDFDAFNHEEDPNAPDQGVRYTAPQEVSNHPAPVAPAASPAPQVEEEIPEAPIVSVASATSINVASADIEVEIDPASITEKKPLEARDTPASQGDNMSQEEVEKW
jgi:hypothetical protein